VALILLLLENQVEATHVESILLPRLDPGSIPGSSTFSKSIQKQTPVSVTFTGVFYF